MRRACSRAMQVVSHQATVSLAGGIFDLTRWWFLVFATATMLAEPKHLVRQSGIERIGFHGLGSPMRRPPSFRGGAAKPIAA